jgi:hypothetical protein
MQVCAFFMLQQFVFEALCKRFAAVLIGRFSKNCLIHCEANDAQFKLNFKV